MYRKLVWKDLMKNKLSSVTLLVFMVVSVMLMSSAVQLSVNLVSSIQNFVKLAKTPDFIQMHKGEVDRDRLEKFVADHPTIEAYQVSDFLNIDGSLIIIDGSPLSNSVQDNGLTVQNIHFDFLLDTDNRPIKVGRGQIYLPLMYHLEGRARLGSQIVIAGQEFVVKGFVRDSQMNSSLALSKRFVVHEADFQALEEKGTMERIIEFRVDDRSSLAQIEKDYIDRDMEADGPPMILAPFVEIINGLTDGMMIALLVVVSIIVLLLSFICLRFVLLAKIEEDYVEIGVLKAIGIRLKEIKAIYLYKYGALALIALGLGFCLSIVLTDRLLSNVEAYMGRSEDQTFPLLLGFITASLVALLILAYIARLLKGFKKISAAQAIRFGAPSNPSRTGHRLKLSQSSLSGMSFLALKDSLAGLKSYATIFFLVTFSLLMATLPISLYQTFSNRDFVTYMGLGQYDLRIDLANMDDMEGKSKNILADLKSSQIRSSGLFNTRLYDVKVGETRTKKLRIESGDHGQFPIRYTKGRAPKNHDQIALSSINADELDKSIGDELTLVIDGGQKTLTVSGIYSDVTYGGRTAKMAYQSEKAPLLWVIIPVQYKAGADIEAEIAALKRVYPEAKIALTQVFLQGIFGSTISAIQTVAVISSFVATGLVFILSLLFIRLLLIQERQKVAMLRALGFRQSEVLRKFMLSVLLIASSGLVVGLVLLHLSGGTIAQLMLSQFGVEAIVLKHPFILTHLTLPILFLLVILLATRLASSSIRKLHISRFIKE